MVASFQLDFSSPQDYLTKVRAIIGGSKDPTSDIQNINTPLVNGVVGKENFTSRDLLEWLPQGLEQDGIVDSGNVGNVLDSENNMTLTIGGKNFTSQTPLDVEHVADNGFDQVVVQLNFKSMKDVGAVVWYFSEQAWGADKRIRSKPSSTRPPRTAMVRPPTRRVTTCLRMCANSSRRPTQWARRSPSRPVLWKRSTRGWLRLSATSLAV